MVLGAFIIIRTFTILGYQCIHFNNKRDTTQNSYKLTQSQKPFHVSKLESKVPLREHEDEQEHQQQLQNKQSKTEMKKELKLKNFIFQ